MTGVPQKQSRHVGPATSVPPALPLGGGRDIRRSPNGRHPWALGYVARLPSQRSRQEPVRQWDALCGTHPIESGLPAVSGALAFYSSSFSN